MMKVLGTRRLMYIAFDEFQKVMGMNKEAFYKLRPWKQKNIKRAKGLF